MMRWLKDKKKEKRTNPTCPIDGSKEDDYGFGKDKSTSKSPSSRRQLPPTPATPEEKSPHIYEEIPDLPLCCTSDADKALLRSKFNKNRNGGVSVAGTVSLGLPVNANPSSTDEISPYMVVPVDNEIRQTPTDFHRNGTPEVHCDVIVKDTHCEIFMTRKPKVGTFRLDSTAFATTADSSCDRRTIRNNTHFCSQDRRASADTHSAGKLSSAFSMASSPFSSSSASKILSAGGPSSLSLVNSFEHHLDELEEGNDNIEEDEKGVVTYAAASNFIPRSTKLTFNPLPGKNPCKEAFGSDTSDELRGVAFSSTKEEDLASSREQRKGSKNVTYASIQSCDNPDSGAASNVIYASVKDLHFADAKLNYSCSESAQVALSTKQHSFLGSSPNDNNGFSCSSRTGIIRPSSPSGSSNCIYASVTFPTEPKLYNTIPDLIPSDCSGNARCQSEDFLTDGLGVVYSRVNGSFGTDVICPTRKNETSGSGKTNEAICSSKSSSNVNDTRNELSQVSCFDVGEGGYGSFGINRTHSTISYPGAPNQLECRNDHDANVRIELNNSRGLEFPKPSSHCGHSLHLDFCSCSDDHSSSYGCPDVKHNHSDDATSVVGATNEGCNSCRSCGRLIRQITYSESYSDETYEHVYASRLLIRTGRRFSSPDITFSEASNSEFLDIQNCRSPEFPYAMSRDDSWTYGRSSDSIPPSYSSTVNPNFLNKIDGRLQSQESNSEVTVELSNIPRDSTQFIGQASCDQSLVKQNFPTFPKSICTVHASSGNLNVTAITNSNLHEMESNQISIHSNDSVLGNPTGGQSQVCSDPQHNVYPAEAALDQNMKRDATTALESKTNAFTGIFSRLSRTKPLRSTKPGSSEISKNGSTVSGENPRDDEVSRCAKDLEEIPEKNTKKLSKFFQRLSSKEAPKSTSECLILPETEDPAKVLVPKDVVSTEKAHSLKVLDSQAVSSSGNKHRHGEDQSTTHHKRRDTADQAHNFHTCTESNEKRIVAQIHHTLAAKSQAFLSDSGHAASAFSEQLSLDASIVNEKDLLHTNLGDASSTKTQFKTDSGDTCYEYDISTSSEGEQTGYEYFLSKVKKTLSLEHEVKHISESSSARRKRLCKRCKKDDEEGAVGGDGFCPHLAAKFSDLRAIFEDLVVDQRAAILDCLTDFMLSPNSVRGHSQERQCRECGCEILASDTESLTTVCSLLSHQFRMTSPNAQALSCDSDEGTMADNSCESADEGCPENGDNKNENNNAHYDDNSSGYDEPKGKPGSTCQKFRKKERKDKTSTSSMCDHASSKEAEEKTSANKSQQDSATGSKLGVRHTDSSTCKLRVKETKETVSSSFISDGPRKSILKKNISQFQSTHSGQAAGLYFSHGTNSKDDNLDHSGICDISRLRANLISDKVLQDIYAPLPSTALSRLTSKNYVSPVGVSCTCGKGPQASLATATAHLSKGETLQPPTECMNRSSASKPSSASLLHCDSNKKNGVVPVQKHLERGGNNSKEGELLVKDSDGQKSDRQKMGVQIDKEVFATANCSSSARNTSESNDCTAPQTKPGSWMSMKERSVVLVKEGSSLRKQPATKQLYGTGIKSDSGLAKVSDRDLSSCSKTPALHAKTTSESLVDETHNVESENPYNDIYDCSPVEFKTEGAKINTRKHRLGLVALDLLPESAVDGETMHATSQTQKKFAQPKRSKVIEKMAKLFESHPDSDVTNRTNTANLVYHKNNSHSESGVITAIPNSHCRPHPNAEGKPVSDTGSATDTSIVSPSKSNLPCTAQSRETRQCNLRGKSQGSNLNFNESPTAADTRNMLISSKTRSTSSRSSQGSEDKIKFTSVKSDIENIKLKTRESKSAKSKTGKVKYASRLTDSRLTTQRSPTPSSSSASSSSSSRKKSEHVKHKRTSRKSYQKRRSKHRSERSKSGHGKEERTYYYFSSDFSDIDVVEVENNAPVTCQLSTNTSSTRLAPTRSSSTLRNAPVTTDGAVANLLEKSANASRSLSDKNLEGASCTNCEQELYAIPSSSSDLQCSRRRSNEMGVSPQPSPEMAKTRKTKRTDVYKSRKNDSNKLLSDLIIRNYDMQVYGNV